jgi:two-component system sensor histidine kinase DegS
MDYQEDAVDNIEQEIHDAIEAELQRVRGMANDLDRTIDQSKGQVEQLRQRNMTVMSGVQRIEGALEQTPRLTIKDAYNEALNVQQRLLTTRAQLEKLQEQRTEIEERIEFLRDLKGMLKAMGDTTSSEKFNAREMVMRVIDAQETERELLARRLHDGPAHQLTNFILQAEICQMLFDRDPSKAKGELGDLKEKASDAFKRVRSFIFDLRPMMLSDLGLVPTMDRYIESFEEKHGVAVDYEGPGSSSRRLENYLEVLVFRGIQAIMTNARDSGATSMQVRLTINNEMVRVEIEDNGRGLGTGELNLDSNNPEAIGLGTLQERVALVGGMLNVNSIPGGTRIMFELPAGPMVDDISDYADMQ